MNNTTTQEENKLAVKFLLIFLSLLMISVPTTLAQEDTERQEFAVIDGERGETYDTIWGSIVDVSGRAAYKAEEDGKTFVVFDGEEPGRDYGWSGDPVEVDGKLAYQATKDGDSFIVFDGREVGKEYQGARSPAEIGGRLAYIANNNSKEFVVLDNDRESREYDEDNYSISVVFDVGGEIAYVVREVKKDQRFVVFDGEEGKRYERISYPASVDGEPAYTAREGNKSSIVKGTEEGEKHDYAAFPISVDGKLAYHVKDDNNWFIVFDGKEIGKEYDYVGAPVEVGEKLAYSVRDEGQYFVVLDDEKVSEEYDWVGNLAEVDGKLTYEAQRDDMWFIVHDGEIVSKKYQEEYETGTSIVDVGGKPAYSVIIGKSKEEKDNGIASFFLDGAEGAPEIVTVREGEETRVNLSGLILSIGVQEGDISVDRDRYRRYGEEVNFDVVNESAGSGEELTLSPENDRVNFQGTDISLVAASNRTAPEVLHERNIGDLDYTVSRVRESVDNSTLYSASYTGGWRAYGPELVSAKVREYSSRDKMINSLEDRFSVNVESEEILEGETAIVPRNGTAFWTDGNKLIEISMRYAYDSEEKSFMQIVEEYTSKYPSDLDESTLEDIRTPNKKFPEILVERDIAEYKFSRSSRRKLEDILDLGVASPINYEATYRRGDNTSSAGVISFEDREDINRVHLFLEALWDTEEKTFADHKVLWSQDVGRGFITWSSGTNLVLVRRRVYNKNDRNWDTQKSRLRPLLNAYIEKYPSDLDNLADNVGGNSDIIIEEDIGENQFKFSSMIEDIPETAEKGYQGLYLASENRSGRYRIDRSRSLIFSFGNRNKTLGEFRESYVDSEGNSDRREINGNTVVTGSPDGTVWVHNNKIIVVSKNLRGRSGTSRDIVEAYLERYPSDLEDKREDEGEEITVQLDEGWNLVSNGLLARNPTEKSEIVKEDLEVIFYYDSEDEEYIRILPDQQISERAIKDIAGEGPSTWVYSEEAGKLTFNTDGVDVKAVSERTLHEGLNLISLEESITGEDGLGNTIEIKDIKGDCNIERSLLFDQGEWKSLNLSSPLPKSLRGEGMIVEVQDRCSLGTANKKIQPPEFPE